MLLITGNSERSDARQRALTITPVYHVYRKKTKITGGKYGKKTRKKKSRKKGHVTCTFINNKFMISFFF